MLMSRIDLIGKRGIAYCFLVIADDSQPVIFTLKLSSIGQKLLYVVKVLRFRSILIISSL